VVGGGELNEASRSVRGAADGGRRSTSRWMVPPEIACTVGCSPSPALKVQLRSVRLQVSDAMTAYGLPAMTTPSRTCVPLSQKTVSLTPTKKATRRWPFSFRPRPTTRVSARQRPAQRWSIGLKERLPSPRYTWRGRAIFCSLSRSISSHCASQPGVRPIAKSTVIMSSGMPIAS